MVLMDQQSTGVNEIQIWSIFNFKKSKMAAKNEGRKMNTLSIWTKLTEHLVPRNNYLWTLHNDSLAYNFSLHHCPLVPQRLDLVECHKTSLGMIHMQTEVHSLCSCNGVCHKLWCSCNVSCSEERLVQLSWQSW